jgi:hypothetical protein
MPILYQLPGVGVGNTLDTTIPVGYDTDLKPSGGTQVVQAEDGTVVVLNMFSNPVYTGSVILPFCTDTERATVETFYNTNKNFVWQFNHPGDGHSYSLYFTDPPHIQRFQADGNLIFRVELPVIGYRN